MGKRESKRELWGKRVERWQASELTAKEFAAEIGVNAGTLSHWKWKLGREAAGEAPKKQRRERRAKKVTFIEVVSSTPASRSRRSRSSSTIGAWFVCAITASMRCCCRDCSMS